jgi:histone-lysine N-methyltransferase SETMAR
MYWEVLPHTAYGPDLAPTDFCLFRPLKEALEGKRFRANDKVKLLCSDGWTNNHKRFFEKNIMKLPKRWQRYTEVQGEYVEK